MAVLINKWFYPLAAFFLIFLIRFPMIHIELEVNDEGYHLINQQLSNIIGIEYATINPIWWFSDVIGGVWLKLSAPYGLWGARLGGVLGNCLVGMIAVRVISLVYKPQWFLVFIVAATTLYTQPGRILYYDSVPEIIFIFFSFFFLKMILDPTKRFYSILCGPILAILFLSKWPMITCVLIPVLAILGCWHLEKQRLRPMIVSCSLTLLIAFAVISSVFVYMAYNNILKDYLFTNAPSPNHTLSYQLGNWYRQLRNKVPLIILFFSLSSCIYYILSIKKSKHKISITCFSLISLFMTSRVFSEFHTPKWYFPFMYQDSTYILMYFLLTTCCLFSIYLLKDSLSLSEFVLFVLAIVFPLCQSIGSAIGVSKVYMGMWLLGGVMFCLLRRVAHKFSYENCRPVLYLLGTVLMSNIAYSGYKYSFYGTGNCAQLTNELHSEKLRGIYTNLERKKSFDSLIAAIVQLTKKGDRILTYEYFPLAYFASDTLPFANRSAWVWMPSDVLVKKIDEFSTLPAPTLIVRSKTDTQRPCWGLKPLILCENMDPKHQAFIRNNMQMLEQAIQKTWKITLVWSNPDFDIYRASLK